MKRKITNLLGKFNYFNRILQSYRNYKERAAYTSIKLIMTLLVKDEEDIIEKNIRFHHAMGCDGFILTLHNCTDKTNDIIKKLKEEGLVLEIIYKTDSCFMQREWVNEMVKIARKKYSATWVINADADEFYYSKSLDLKKSIIKDAGKFANVLKLDSLMLLPDDRDDFLSCPYFVTRPLHPFEEKELGITINKDYTIIDTGLLLCPKVIHQTKGNPLVSMGNHSVIINNPIIVGACDIKLYHYHIRNYKKFIEKIMRYIDTAPLMKQGMGWHMKEMIRLYKEGRLRDMYDSKYGKERREFLLSQGIAQIDHSVYNFLKYKNIM